MSTRSSAGSHLHRRAHRVEPTDEGAVGEPEDAQVGPQVAGHVEEADLGATQLGGVPEGEHLHARSP